MTDERINLKNPVIAGILAFLVPGAGHLYQGRMFKAAVYFVCILGLFFSGMAMAEWKAVQPPVKGPAPGKKLAMLKYAAQLCVGTPSIVGLVQRERYHSEANQQMEQTPVSLTTTFKGSLELRTDVDAEFSDVEGLIHLNPIVDNYGDKVLTGTVELKVNGEIREFQLGPYVQLGKPIEASEERALSASIVSSDRPQDSIGSIRGSIPRPFFDWYQVPMQQDEVLALHGKLGKFHEIAMVFTWVAGLLNVLAIWDAVEGPAYGFGEESTESEDQKPKEEAAVATA